MFSYACSMCSTIHPNALLTYSMKTMVNAMDWPQSNFQGARPRRFSVSGESIQPKDRLFLETVPKSDHEKSIIRAATLDHFVFMLLNSEQYEQVVQAMSKKRVPKHAVIAQQGDYADRFYVVESGQLGCLLDDVHVGQHEAGEGFGDLSLLHNGRWPMSYVAATDAVLWEIDRVTFRMIVVAQSVHQRQEASELLSKMHIFNTLQQDDLYRIADVLRKVEYQDGDVVFSRGKADEDTVYIIDHGTAIAISNGQKYGSIFTKGDCFGAPFDHYPPQVLVIAQGPLTCLTLDKKALYRLLGHPMYK